MSATETRSVRCAVRRSGVALGVVIALAGAHAHASSHREAPYVTQNPKIDATDFYLFSSYEPNRGDYVTLIANYVPLQDAYGGPNYFTLDPSAIYEIHVDNDADAIENLTFRFTFDNALGGDGGEGIALDIDGESVAIPLKAAGALGAGMLDSANFSETYSVSMISGDRRSGQTSEVASATDGGQTEFAKPFDYIGTKTFSDYAGYVDSLGNSGSAWNDVTLAGCPAGMQDGRVFVGQRKDPFAIALGAIFDLVNLDPLSDVEDAAGDDLADKNVTTLALEVHKDCLSGSGNGVIGAWTTASRPQATVYDPTPSFASPEVTGGAYAQLSRLGNPLVNEVIIGLPDKDRFNASEPKDDAQFAVYVTNPTLPAILNLVFNADGGLNPDGSIAPSNFPRGDLVAAFLTGVENVTQMQPADGAELQASEMLRLNTGVPATAMAEQQPLGVAAGDLAGFPNGRRPGDDITDIALRAVMGAFCHDLPIGENGADANLMLCGGMTAEENQAAAPTGTAPFNDGVPQNAMQFGDTFPYLATPLPGAGN